MIILIFNSAAGFSEATNPHPQMQARQFIAASRRES